MALPLSLRAKRGNPEANAARSGLPRRYAPRNDGFLGAFAPWRETNLLFSSREGAKARRNKCGFLWFLIAFLAGTSSALACPNLSPQGRRMEAQREARYLAKADRIVTGTWAFVSTQKEDLDAGMAYGKLTVLRKNGDVKRVYNLYAYQNIACGFPNFPFYFSRDEMGEFYGRFYLEKDDGDYQLLHFVPLERPK